MNGALATFVTAASGTPCWKTYATGLLVGLMGWTVFIGSKRFKKARESGDQRTALMTGAVIVLVTIVGLGIIGAGMGSGA